MLAVSRFIKGIGDFGTINEPHCWQVCTGPYKEKTEIPIAKGLRLPRFPGSESWNMKENICLS
jgi:hypothetical protein